MSLCRACGFDDTLVVETAWEFTLPVKAESGNKIGSGGRGRSGWKYRQERKKYMGAMGLVETDCTQACKKRRLWLTRLWGKRQRAFDIDNLQWGMKPLVDEIVARGWLLDDTPAKVERIYKQEKSPDGHNYILVRIEDIVGPE